MLSFSFALPFFFSFLSTFASIVDGICKANPEVPVPPLSKFLSLLCSVGSPAQWSAASAWVPLAGRFLRTSTRALLLLGLWVLPRTPPSAFLGVDGDEGLEIPVGGGLFLVACGLTPEAGAFSSAPDGLALATVSRWAAGEEAFGGVTGASNLFLGGSFGSGGFLRAPTLATGGVTRAG